MARIPYQNPETAPQAIRDLLLPNAPRNVVLLFGHAETNYPLFVKLLVSILSEQKLDPVLRELAILRVAKLSRAPYEWNQHVAIGSFAGVTPGQIAALDDGRTDAECFSELQRFVLRLTTRVVEDATAPAEMVAEATRYFTPRELVELLIAVGAYMAVARLMNVLAIDPEAALGSDLAQNLTSGERLRSMK